MIRINVLAVLALGLASCDYRTADDLITGTAAEPIIDLVVASDSIPADGHSSIGVQARVSDLASHSPRTVTFHATAGSFSTSDAQSSSAVAMDRDGVAVERLIAPQRSGLAVVSARYGTVAAVDSVRFRAALPERLRLEASTFAVPAGAKNSITVTAHLTRGSGTVTEEVDVSWSARDTLGTILGAFSNAAWTPGSAAVKYTAGPTEYRGPVVLRAATAQSEAAPLADSLVVWVVDPQ